MDHCDAVSAFIEADANCTIFNQVSCSFIVIVRMRALNKGSLFSMRLQLILRWRSWRTKRSGRAEWLG